MLAVEAALEVGADEVAGGAVRAVGADDPAEAGVLVPGGRLCAAVVHPLNSAGGFTSREADSPYVVEGSYFARRRYADAVARDGLEMTFHSRHRPLEDYTGALERSGFVVEALREPVAPPETVRDASNSRWQRMPLFVHLRARLDR